jgi:hypothetical protein
MSAPAINFAAQFDDPTYMEQVYSALFSLLKSAVFASGVTLKSSWRAIMAPDRVNTDDQPALVLINGPIDIVQREFSLSKVTFGAVAVIYMMGDGAAAIDQAPGQIPATQANYLIWGLMNAFGQSLESTSAQPKYLQLPNTRQTLGGLVYHAWIEGKIIPEVAAQQCVITVPILMLAGPSE